MAGDRPVGALNIYSRYRAPFGAAEQELASIFVTEASVLLRDGGADVSDAALAGRLNEALSTRKLIAQAQGVVVTREGVTADDAYTVLRRFSVGRGQRLGGSRRRGRRFHPTLVRRSPTSFGPEQ